MENLTDLLTNIFVSHKPKNKQPEFIPEESTSESDAQTSSSSSSSSRSSSSSDKTSKHSSHIYSSKHSQNSKDDNYDNDDNDDSSESSYDTSSLSSTNSGSSNAIKKTKVPESVREGREVPKQSIKKLVLKASEFYKKNMLIINNDNYKNIDILNDILFKMSKLNDVENIYDNSLHIFTFNENKKNFRDMLLENPYLYFNNLIIKNTLTLPELESDKRYIFIIDYSIKFDVEKLQKLINKDNVHIIIYNDDYSSNMVDVYKLLGDNALIINSKDRLKILQKRFYSKIVKHLVNNANINNFFDVINDDNLDVKYLMIKNNELRYS
jgi:hypothetical protein